MTELNNKNYEPNNYIVLTGNTGAEAQEHTISESGDTFVSLSIYTSNSYKDENGELKEYPSTRHEVVAFDPWLQRELRSYKSGTRLRIQGKLNYRTFEIMIDDKLVNKREATIVAKKVETAILPSKKKPSSEGITRSEELETA